MEYGTCRMNINLACYDLNLLLKEITGVPLDAKFVVVFVSQLVFFQLKCIIGTIGYLVTISGESSRRASTGSSLPSKQCNFCYYYTSQLAQQPNFSSSSEQHQQPIHKQRTGYRVSTHESKMTGPHAPWLQTSISIFVCCKRKHINICPI